MGIKTLSKLNHLFYVDDIKWYKNGVGLKESARNLVYSKVQKSPIRLARK